jgi:restriction system protein
MPIPDYQTIMLPLLRFARDGQVHKKHEAVEYLADVGLGPTKTTI